MLGKQKPLSVEKFTIEKLQGRIIQFYYSRVHTVKPLNLNLNHMMRRLLTPLIALRTVIHPECLFTEKNPDGSLFM